MPNIVQVKGVQAILNALKKEGLKRAKTTGTVTVGYTQKYALAVHETNRAYKNGRLWKYLEIPTRQLSNSGALTALIRKTALATGNITTGLKIGALRIQKESMKIVPLDTGALRASAFVGIGDGIKESEAAFSKSEALRNKKKK